MSIHKPVAPGEVGDDGAGGFSAVPAGAARKPVQWRQLAVDDCSPGMAVAGFEEQKARRGSAVDEAGRGRCPRPPSLGTRIAGDELIGVPDSPGTGPSAVGEGSATEAGVEQVEVEDIIGQTGRACRGRRQVRSDPAELEAAFSDGEARAWGYWRVILKPARDRASTVTYKAVAAELDFGSCSTAGRIVEAHRRDRPRYCKSAVERAGARMLARAATASTDGSPIERPSRDRGGGYREADSSPRTLVPPLWPTSSGRAESSAEAPEPPCSRSLVLNSAG